MTLHEYLEWGRSKENLGARLIPLWLEVIGYKDPRPVFSEEPADEVWFLSNAAIVDELMELCNGIR